MASASSSPKTLPPTQPPFHAGARPNLSGSRSRTAQGAGGGRSSGSAGFDAFRFYTSSTSVCFLFGARRSGMQDADWLSTKDSGHGESEMGDADWDVGRESPIDPLLGDGLHGQITGKDIPFPRYGDIPFPRCSCLERTIPPSTGWDTQFF